MIRYLPAEGPEDDLDIRIELAEHLTTGPAGRGRFRQVGGDDDLGELPATRRDCGKYRIALGTDGQPEAHILYIAAFEKPSVLRHQHRTNQKLGIRGVGTLGCLN